MGKRIVVIGSGLAGSLICNELVKTYDVTLLEAGPGHRVSYPRVDFTKKDFGVVKTFCLGHGGTTNIWDNGLIPIHPGDVASESFSHVLTEAAPYMDKAAAALFFANKPYRLEYESACAEMSKAAARVGVFPDGVDSLLYPKQHKGLAVTKEVDAFFEVTDVEFTVKNDRVASTDRLYVRARFPCSLTPRTRTRRPSAVVRT